MSNSPEPLETNFLMGFVLDWMKAKGKGLDDLKKDVVRAALLHEGSQKAAATTLGVSTRTMSGMFANLGLKDEWRTTGTALNKIPNLGHETGTELHAPAQGPPIAEPALVEVKIAAHQPRKLLNE